MGPFCKGAPAVRATVMKTLIEHLTVALIAVFMAFVGYWLIGRYNGSNSAFVETRDLGWSVWSSIVSITTWFILYRVCRRLHWLVLPMVGLFSPILGALLFFIPYTFAPFLVIWEYAVVFFPVGVATGFLVTTATLPFRPRAVLHGNA